VRRTKEADSTGRPTYVLGNALDVPYRAASFDVVWGQECLVFFYVTDKERLVCECARVVRPGGPWAFTDWLETGAMSDGLWDVSHAFMAFPLTWRRWRWYARLAEAAGLHVVEQEDPEPGLRQARPALRPMPCRRPTRPNIVAGYGQPMYDEVERGLSHPVAGCLGSGPGRPRRDHRTKP